MGGNPSMIKGEQPVSHHSSLPRTESFHLDRNRGGSCISVPEEYNDLENKDAIWDRQEAYMTASTTTLYPVRSTHQLPEEG